MSKKLEVLDQSLFTYSIITDEFITNKIKGTKSFNGTLLDKRTNTKKTGITFLKTDLEIIVNELKSRGYKLTLRNIGISDKEESDKEEIIDEEKEKIFEKFSDEVYSLLLKSFTIGKTPMKLFDEMKPSEIKILSEMKSSAFQNRLTINKLRILEMRDIRYHVYLCNYVYCDYDRNETNDHDTNYDKIYIVFTNSFVGAIRFSENSDYMIKRKGEEIDTCFFETYYYQKYSKLFVVHPDKTYTDILVDFIFRIASGLDKNMMIRRSDTGDYEKVSKINTVLLKRGEEDKIEDSDFKKISDWIFGYADLNKLESDFLMSLKKYKKENSHKSFAEKRFDPDIMDSHMKEIQTKKEKMHQRLQEINERISSRIEKEELIKKEFGYITGIQEESPQRTKKEEKEMERLKILTEREKTKKLTTAERQRKEFLHKKYFSDRSEKNFYDESDTESKNNSDDDSYVESLDLSDD